MRAFLEPRSVVLIGVTRKTGPGAYNNLELLLRYGYQGSIYVVHPKADEILGFQTYARVGDLPEVPELAVISVGRDKVLDVFSECAMKGIRRVVVISQGFADSDEHGKKLQNQLVKNAHDREVRIIGPNTLGIVNAFYGFTTAFMDIARDISPPPLAIVAQSGVLQVGAECFTGGYGKAVDIGNGCDIDFADVLAYLENDPQVRVIALHVEGIKCGREFLNIAGRVSRRKPIVILKPGRSDAGAKAALSHTGSLTGKDIIVNTALQRAGLIRVNNMIEMHAVCRSLLKFQSMTGPRLGIVTATGACGIMAADACENYGLELAAAPENAARDMNASLVPWVKVGNPMDIWPLGMISGDVVDKVKRGLSTFLNDPGTDAVLAILPALASPLHDDLDFVSTLKELNRINTQHKPIALWIYGGQQIGVCEAVEEESAMACFSSIEEAVMGLGACWHFHRLRKAEPQLPKLHYAPRQASSLLHEGLIIGQKALQVLDSYGIPIVAGRIVADLDSALATAEELGYPVVLKVNSQQWPHKSDWGGVRLHITSQGEVRRSFEILERLLRNTTPRETFDGLLIQKELSGTELLVGIKKDPQFGPVLAVATGGIYTEEFKDAAWALVPISQADAEDMVQSLRIYPILRGTRGQKGVNLDMLVQVLRSVSRLAEEHPEITEMDLNPIFANDVSCSCVDCRILVGGLILNHNCAPLPPLRSASGNPTLQ